MASKTKTIIGDTNPDLTKEQFQIEYPYAFAGINSSSIDYKLDGITNDITNNNSGFSLGSSTRDVPSSYITHILGQDIEIDQEIVGGQDSQDLADSQNNLADDTSLLSPTNYTDPFVYHDPEFSKSSVAKLDQPQNQIGDDDIVGNPNEPYDSRLVDGIFWPVIKVNNMVVDDTMIESMVIHYDDFYPSLMLTLYDSSNYISFADVPGPNNVITVVMLPSLQNVYKSISIDFYIDNVRFDKDRHRVYYSATYKFLPFEQKLTAQLKYPGCSMHLGDNAHTVDSSMNNVSCNKEPQAKPNTWEYLHMICMDTGLGFAATDKVQTIQDRLPRIINNMTYREYIQRQMLISGVDEDSVFDCWIDLYRYLVVVNVSYEMNEDISYRQLAINANLGIDATDADAPKPRTKYVHRTLTNYSSTGEPSDLTFTSDNFKEVANTALSIKGFDQQSNIMNIKGAASNTGIAPNSIETIDLKINVNSVDGQYREDFATLVINPCTIRVDSEYNTNMQRCIRENFFYKLRSRRYELILDKPNYGLMRGTLVNIAYFTDDPTEKQILLSSMGNLVGQQVDGQENTDLEIDGKTIRDLIQSEAIQLPVPSKSGLYYIDGMEFDYNANKQTITQKLYLIRRGNESSYQNRHTYPRINQLDNNGSVIDTEASNNRLPADVNTTYPQKLTSDGQLSEKEIVTQALSKRIQGYDRNYDYIENIGTADYLLSSADKERMSSLGISYEDLATAYKPTDEDKKWYM